MLYSFLEKNEEKEKKSVIVKVGNKWKILKKNRRDYWDADYDTNKDAQAALRAYWANKKWTKKEQKKEKRKIFFVRKIMKLVLI